MPPRRRANLNSTGFVSVRARPGGHFAAEICAAGERVWLGTFNIKEEATRAYGATVWRFGRPRRDMNFPEIVSQAQVERVAPRPRFVSQEDERRHRQGQRWLAIAEGDERAMAQWRSIYPEDVEYEPEFWKAKKAERRTTREEKRRRKAAILAEYATGPSSTLDPNSDRWLDVIETTALEDTDSDFSDWD